MLRMGLSIRISVQQMVHAPSLGSSKGSMNSYREFDFRFGGVQNGTSKDSQNLCFGCSRFGGKVFTLLESII
jgi:hypothetical protein